MHLIKVLGLFILMSTATNGGGGQTEAQLSDDTPEELNSNEESTIFIPKRKIQGIAQRSFTSMVTPEQLGISPNLNLEADCRSILLEFYIANLNDATGQWQLYSYPVRLTNHPKGKRQFILYWENDPLEYNRYYQQLREDKEFINAVRRGKAVQMSMLEDDVPLRAKEPKLQKWHPLMPWVQMRQFLRIDIDENEVKRVLRDTCSVRVEKERHVRDILLSRMQLLKNARTKTYYWKVFEDDERVNVTPYFFDIMRKTSKNYWVARRTSLKDASRGKLFEKLGLTPTQLMSIRRWNSCQDDLIDMADKVINLMNR